MSNNRWVWKGVAAVSLLLLLFSTTTAAFDMDAKMDRMKANMQLTFEQAFGSQDSTPQPDSTTDSEDPVPDTSTDDEDTGDETDADPDTDTTTDTDTDVDADADDANTDDQTADTSDSSQNMWGYYTGGDSTGNSDTDNEPADTVHDSDDSDDTSSDSTWGWHTGDDSDASDADDTGDDTDNTIDDSDDETDDNPSDETSDDATDDSGTDGWSSDDSTADSSQDETDSSGDLDTLSFEERTERYLHGLINEERQKRGLTPFNFDSELQQTADYKSQDMAERNYFAHTSPTGDSFQDIYDRFGYSCRIPHGGSIYLGGENIAKTWYDRTVRTGSGGSVHYSSAQELAEGLRRQRMTSDPHRKAILRPYYQNHGLGVEITSSNQVYATEHFC